MRIRRMTAPPDLREFDEKIADVRRDKESAIDAQDFEKAAQLRDKEKQLWPPEGAAGEGVEGRRPGRRRRGRRGADRRGPGELDRHPGLQAHRGGDLPAAAHGGRAAQAVIGQEDAVKAVSKAIRRTRAGLKDPKRPSGSFIFAGPSGVGKTELSKTLAEFLFGDEDALIQLDMSEFHEKHTVSRLVGSPPGYVGYDEGGQLTEKVRRKPFSVVLFDEIEKAHPDVFNTLLQILEDGRLTDAQGRIVDFKNTVIIMTTNLGTRDISKAVSLGFRRRRRDRSNYERMKNKVNDELKQHFRPEFLNRIDDIIVFHQLTRTRSCRSST
jgi:ATP-dependent Clp protease ATP-binding subunit ClpC